jgi:5-methyltetrahydropteroyltriglutamate--homocysteine methyltransferase
MGSRIQTTVVGSYPVPSWLVGNSSRLVLRDAILAVLKVQELAGLDLISDGELQRFDPGHPETNGMIDYFVAPMEGIQTRYSKADVDRFRADSGLAYRSAPAGIVVGKIGPGTLNLGADYELVRPLTDRRLKFTATGPHMLAKVLTDRFYPDRAALAMDIAKVLRAQIASIDADVVQIDEANISGHPEESDWAAPALNHVLDGVRGEKAVHICFGNYGGQTVQKGFWRTLLPLCNALHADHLVLEFARRGYGEIEIFRDLDSRIGLGVGMVDVKDNEIEKPETIARRLEEVTGALGEGRVRYIHPDCGLWMLQRSVADRKLRALVEGRNLFEGRS